MGNFTEKHLGFFLLRHLENKRMCKMKNQLKAEKFLYMLLFVTIISMVALNGEASADLKPYNQSGEDASGTSGFVVNTSSYELLPNDPYRISRIRVEVISPSGGEMAAFVAISVDGGVSWVTCENLAGTTWVCDFPHGSELLIRDFSQLRVTVKS
jgi:hypothetical protein